MSLFDDENKEEAELLSLLFRDGEPSEVAKEFHLIAHNTMVEKYRELKRSKDAASSDRDGKGKLKDRVKTDWQVIYLAARELMEQDPLDDDNDRWSYMLAEIRYVLRDDNGITISTNKLKKILIDKRRSIERLAAMMSKGPF